MADNNQNDNNESQAKTQTAYFRSRFAGLKVVVGEAPEGELEQEFVAFTPYWERWDGDRVRVGYLATDNPVAIEKLSADDNVEKITKTDFEAATDTERAKKPAVRAPL